MADRHLLEHFVRRRIDRVDRASSSLVTYTTLPSGRIVTPSGSSPIFTVATTVPDGRSTTLTCAASSLATYSRCAVGADVELLGIVAGVDDALHLVGVGVDFADAVGAAIGRRQRLRIDAGPGVGRAAERDVERFAVGARLDAARALAERRRARSRSAVARRSTVRSPDASLVTYTLTRGSGGGAGAGAAVAGAGLGGSLLQAGAIAQRERKSDPAMTGAHGRDDRSDSSQA